MLFEVRNTSVLTAITGSILNSLAAAEARELPAYTAAYLPPDPVVFAGVAYRIVEVGGCAETYNILSSLYSGLAAAKALLQSRASPRNGLGFGDRPSRFSPGSSRPISSESLGELVDAWRGLAGRALLAIYELERIQFAVHNDLEAGEGENLPAMLRAVRDGSSPCLLEGRPVMPSWAQRRRHRRVLLNMMATARYGGQTREVLVVDVSQGGLAMDFADDVEVGTVVSLRLSNGRRLAGSVAWSHNRKAGIAFFRELSAKDPLISAG